MQALLGIALAALAWQDAAAPPRHDPRASALVTLDGEHPWSFEGDRAAWERRRERARRQVLVAAGLWPLEERPPARALVRGEIDRGDYRVRHVLLETWPGFWLTGNLYLPTRLDGPAPAVLSPHGHWSDGRLYRRPDDEVAAELASGAERDEEAARYPLQARCAQLARLGCVVLHYDMAGYGDARQLGHDDAFTDLGALLWGESHLGFQTWSSLRALDFLAAMPEVDGTRIGVTGASGGGTQTFVLCAIDERPAAAFPAVMVSSAMQGGCVCENAPHLRVGTTNVELAALFAPKPLMLSAANDWTLEVEAKGLPALRSVWSSYGREQDVAARCWPEFGHNYNVHAREAMYGWFARHLRLELSQPLREQPFEPIEPGALSVFASGGLPEGALDAAGIRAAVRGISEARAAALVPEDAAALERFRAVVGGALEVLVHTSLEELAPVAARELTAADGARELLLAPADGRGEVPVTVLSPAEPSGVVCVAVGGAGRAALLDPTTPAGAALRRGLAGGATFVLPEVLLGAEEARGEPARLPVDPERHARYGGYTWGYNRCLFAERVRDVLSAVAFARGLTGARRVVLWGEGSAGGRALVAAALARGALDRVLVDADQGFADVRSLDDPELLPGALRYGGAAAFAGLCAPAELRLAGRAEPPEVTRACYRSAGVGGRLETAPGPSPDSVPWLLATP